MSTQDPVVAACLERHDLVGALRHILGDQMVIHKTTRQRIHAEIVAPIGTPLGELDSSDLANIWNYNVLNPWGCAQALVYMRDGPWRDRLLEVARRAFSDHSWRTVHPELLTHLRLTAAETTDPEWNEILWEESLTIPTLDGGLHTMERDGDPCQDEPITVIEVLTQVADLEGWRALAARVRCELEHLSIEEDLFLCDAVGSESLYRVLTRGPSSAPEPRWDWTWMD